MTSTVMSIESAVLAGLWASIVDASIFAVLVVAAIKLAKPSASTRHLLNWLVLVIAFAVPVASVAASLNRIETTARPATSSLPATDTPRNGRIVVHRATVEPTHITVPRSRLYGAALGTWLSVALYKVLALCIELFALRNLKRRARPLDAARLATLREYQANAHSLRAASIATSSDIDVPCAAGLWSPAILLPQHVVADQTAADIDRIVMHESAHLARYDDWTNVFERVLGAVLWCNPALAFARSRIAVDREIACDDWVVKRMGEAHGYASCLFRLAAASCNARPTAHALGALGNARHITQRIEHLLSSPKRQSRRVARTLLATLGICALTLTIVQAMQAPAIAIDQPAPVSVAPAMPAAPAVAPLAAPRTPQTLPRVHARHAPPVAPTAPQQGTLSPENRAEIRADAIAISKAARALAAENIERIRRDMVRSNTTHPSDSIDAIVRKATDLGLAAAAAGIKASLEATVAEAHADDAHVRAETMRVKAEALRERTSGESEALKANVEAMRQSREVRAEVRRALQEMREELRHEGMTSGP